MPSLRSDKEDDTDEEWTTEDRDEEWQQGNANYNCRKLANKNWLIFKSINFWLVVGKYYLTQLTTKRKSQLHWYISKVEPVQGGWYVTIYSDLWYNDLQCNPSKMRKTMIINHVLKPNIHNFKRYYQIHLVVSSLRFLSRKRYNKAFLSKWFN